MKKKMLKFNLLLAIFIMLFCSCKRNLKQQETQNQQDTARVAKTVIPHEDVSGVSCDSTVVSNEFSSEALAFDIFKADTNKVKSLFLDAVTLKIEKQTNSEGSVYDLYNFNDGANKTILSRGNSGFYIEDAEIRNNKVLLNKKISIGMNKGDLLELLKIKNIKCDTISVTDDESTFESVFVFKDSKLQQLLMGQIVE